MQPNELIERLQKHKEVLLQNKELPKEFLEDLQAIGNMTPSYTKEEANQLLELLDELLLLAAQKQGEIYKEIEKKSTHSASIELYGKY